LGAIYFLEGRQMPQYAYRCTKCSLTGEVFEKLHGHKGEKAVESAITTWNENHENPTKGSGKFRPK
jgi:predicted nucleic acid-binding Zn ribbon protein